MSETKPKNFYVDKEVLYKAYVDWYADIEACKALGNPEPPIPTVLGKAMMDIPRGLANRPNFSGYTYKEELISDAIENLVAKCRNFDPTRYNNVFGYYTQISYFSFLRGLRIEKIHAKTKTDIAEASLMLNTITTQDHDKEKFVGMEIPIIELLQDDNLLNGLYNMPEDDPILEGLEKFMQEETHGQ